MIKICMVLIATVIGSEAGPSSAKTGPAAFMPVASGSSAAVEPHKKNEGEAWSEKRYACWEKYREAFSSKVRKLGQEKEEAHQKAAELRTKLTEKNVGLDSLRRKEEKLASSGLSKEALMKERQAIHELRARKESSIDEDAGLKEWKAKEKDKSRQMRKILKDLVANDKGCSEYLLGSAGAVR